MIIQGFILLIIFIFLFVVSYRNTRDLFSPICFFSFFSILRYVPYLMLGKYEKLTFQHLDFNNTFVTFMYVLIATISVLVGYLLSKSVIKNRHIRFANREVIEKEYKTWHIVILYAIGIFARIRIILFAGGIFSILYNRAEAYSSLDNGTGLLYLLANCVIISCMIQLSNCIKAVQDKQRTKAIKRGIALFLMVAAYIISIVIFTSRSPILELIMFLVFGINYLHKKIDIVKLFKLKYIAVIAFILAIIVILPRIRISSYNEQKNDESLFWELSDQFTLVGRDTFVYNYFSENDFWYGKSYLGLFTAFIPSSIYEKKPSVDDGCYLSNMIYGYNVKPLEPGKDLTVKYSIPFSTNGLAYANFGVLGIVFINIIVGYLYGIYYFSMRNSKSVKKIILYELIIYQLEITTLSIVQTLMPMIICILFFRFFAKEK